MDRKRRTMPVLGLVAPLTITGGVALGSFSGSYPRESATSMTAARALGAAGLWIASGSTLYFTEENGQDVFQRQCAVCHGDDGRGDGPASVALRPKPADLTDPKRMGDSSQEDLLAVIGKGKGMMPAFGAVLTPQELEDVAAYVSSLSDIEAAGDR